MPDTEQLYREHLLQDYYAGKISEGLLTFRWITAGYEYSDIVNLDPNEAEELENNNE